jgi:hypothetical protein
MYYSLFLAGFVAVSPGGGIEPPTTTPSVELDKEIHGSSRGFIVVHAKTNGQFVQWVALDSGLTLIPPQLLRDSKTAVLMAERAGRFRLLAYTAIADMPSAPTITTIVVDAASPPQNPTQPPESKATVWAVVIQPDGPLSPDLGANRKHAAWARLKERGVQLSWVELSAVDPSFANEITGLNPPILLVLHVRNLNGKPVSTVISRQSLPTPEVAERLVLEALR